jgi:SNF2 family DNA or RNA helicase
MRQTTGVAKAKTVAAFARMMVEAGEAVVLWGWHREVYEIWNKEFSDLRPAMYTGSETASKKEAAKARFLAGETDVLIMSLRSGAGVDGLQARCATGIFGELDWSPGIHQQCIWRLDREGQTSPVTALFLVTDDGSDPPMMDVLGIKASEAQHIVDPHLGVEVRENDTGHLRKLVERYLDRKAGAA